MTLLLTDPRCHTLVPSHRYIPCSQDSSLSCDFEHMLFWVFATMFLLEAQFLQATLCCRFLTVVSEEHGKVSPLWRGDFAPRWWESSVFHNVMSYLVFTQCTQAECETALLRQTLFMSSLWHSFHQPPPHFSPRFSLLTLCFYLHCVSFISLLSHNFFLLLQASPSSLCLHLHLLIIYSSFLLYRPLRTPSPLILHSVLAPHTALLLP